MFVLLRRPVAIGRGGEGERIDVLLKEEYGASCKGERQERGKRGTRSRARRSRTHG